MSRFSGRHLHPADMRGRNGCSALLILVWNDSFSPSLRSHFIYLFTFLPSPLPRSIPFPSPQPVWSGSHPLTKSPTLIYLHLSFKLKQEEERKKEEGGGGGGGWEGGIQGRGQRRRDGEERGRGGRK